MRMLNTSIKIFALFISLFIFLSSFGYASETRVGTMGNGSIFVKDESNVMMFPGLLLQYSDLVVAEMRSRDTKGDYSLGVHLNLENNMAAGLYVNLPVNSVLLEAGKLAIDPGSTGAENGYGFFFGTRMAGFNVGGGIISAGSTVENGTGDAKVEETAGYIALVGGASNKQMDLGVMLELPSLERKTSGATGSTTSFGGFGVSAQGRIFMLKMNGLSIFPVGRVGFGTGTFDVSGTSVEVGVSTLSFAGGVGIEKPINEDNILIIGIEAFGYSSFSTDVKNGDEDIVTITTLPGIYLGVESRISSWLIGRLGGQHVNQSRVTENKPDGGDTSEFTVKSSQFHLAMGLGMEFGNFLVDVAMNEELFFDGPYIFDGAGRGDDFAYQLSVTYNFGGSDE